MAYHFAVWEYRDGKHDGYVVSSPVNAPLMSDHAVGFRGATSFHDALESVKAHRAAPCDGSCARFLAAKNRAK